MAEVTGLATVQLARQVAHWSLAASRLGNLDDLAAPEAWSRLESYLGVALRRYLTNIVERLQRKSKVLQAELEAVEDPAGVTAIQEQLLAFRRQYLRTETTLDFFADAINTRASIRTGAIMRACDILAQRSMSQLLDALGKPTPVVLSYIDKGLGASILKAGLRLWDGGSESPVAAIKIVRHNLPRPTALIHEAGHQVAHILAWNQELAATLESGLRKINPDVAEIWAAWASEIAADAFAFVHTGYASVAALHDVVAGEKAYVFRMVPGDPHPVGYLRVLLGVEMCRHYYGAGPWDDLALAWTRQHSTQSAGSATSLLQASLPLLTNVVRLTLDTPMRAFGGRSLSTLLSPERVRPSVLEALERRLGSALYTSTHWIWTEALRVLALTGLRVATRPERAVEVLKQQDEWMSRLGGTLQAT